MNKECLQILLAYKKYYELACEAVDHLPLETLKSTQLRWNEFKLQLV